MVNLTISESLDGSAVADSLAGGGTGLDFGSVSNGSYTNVISKPSNTGALALYIRHDATIDPVTNFKAYIDSYTATGFTYGGAVSAASDYTAIKALGTSSGSSKNNNDGLSGGLWMDMDADATTANQFDQASYPTLVKIFGDSTTDGIDLASAFTVKADALVYAAPAETLASAPQDGKIGINNDTVLGDNAKLKFRVYIPNSYTSGGIFQYSLVN